MCWSWKEPQTSLQPTSTFDRRPPCLPLSLSLGVSLPKAFQARHHPNSILDLLLSAPPWSTTPYPSSASETLCSHKAQAIPFPTLGHTAHMAVPPAPVPPHIPNWTPHLSPKPVPPPDFLSIVKETADIPVPCLPNLKQRSHLWCSYQMSTRECFRKQASDSDRLHSNPAPASYSATSGTLFHLLEPWFSYQ